MPSKKSVVIIDDEPGFREILQDALEDEGYIVHTAPDGVEALALLRQLDTRPCIVLCDLLMPRMDGATLYREVKADSTLHDLTFVFMSTDPMRAIPGEQFIKKPPNLQTIFDIVRKCCESSVSSVA